MTRLLLEEYSMKLKSSKYNQLHNCSVTKHTWFVGEMPKSMAHANDVISFMQHIMEIESQMAKYRIPSPYFDTGYWPWDPRDHLCCHYPLFRSCNLLWIERQHLPGKLVELFLWKSGFVPAPKCFTLHLKYCRNLWWWS